MTDNIAVTPGAGVTVLADGLTDGVLGAGIVQFVKLMDGALDSSNKLIVSAAGAAKVDGSAVTQPISAPLSVLAYADAARTRPNNATAYAANQYIGDATDGAFKFTSLFRANGGTGYLNELRLFASKSGGLSVPAGVSIRGMIYNAAGSAVADQSAFNLTEALRSGEGRLGFVDFTTTYTGGASSDEFEMVAAPTWPMLLQAAGSARDLYVVLIATGAWTPVASMVFNLRASVSLEQ